MKKAVSSIVLVFLGGATWWLLAHTARFSIKKWDAKFETVLRERLNDFGLTNNDLVSSVHEIRTDKNGEWAVHRLTLKGLNRERRSRLRESLERSGADIQERLEDKDAVFVVKRGGRVYQEIRFRGQVPSLSKKG